MSYDAAVLADTPWGYWKLQETSGAPQDASGNARHMTVTGTLTYAQTGPASGHNAILFPAGANRLNTAAQLTTSPCTMEIWLYVSALPSSGLTVFGMNRNSSATHGSEDKIITLHSDGSIRWYVHNGSAQNLQTAAGVVSTGVWYHVVCSVGAAGMKIRVNKTTHATNTGVTTSYTGGAQNQHIHATQTNGGNNSNGAFTVAYAAVYASQLTDVRTDAHYDALAAAVTENRISSLSGQVLTQHSEPPVRIPSIAGLVLTQHSQPPVRIGSTSAQVMLGKAPLAGTAVWWYDGGALIDATMLGWWDGASILPVERLGWWNGSAIAPLE